MPFDNTNDSANVTNIPSAQPNDHTSSATTNPSPTSAPAQPAPPAQQPARAPQTQPAQQPQQQQQSQTVSNPSAQPQAQQQPKHAWAERIRDVAEVLAGGPQYQTKINDDGSRTVQKVPVSGRHLGLALALETISGALGGLAAGRGRGPGAAFVGGQQQGQQLVQQRQQAQQQEINEQDKTLVRRAAVMEANLRQLSNSIQIGRLQREDHEAMVKMYDDQLQEWKETAPELIKAEHVPGSEAAKLDTHNAVDYLRIPDGVTPRIGDDGRQVYMDSSGRIVPEGTPGAVPQWDNTYAIIDKSAKTPLTKDGQPVQWVKDAVSWGLPGWNKSFLRAAAGSGLPAATAVRAQHQVVMLNALQSELNAFAKSFGTNHDGSPKVTPVDLKAAITGDGSLLKAIQQFQRSAGMSVQPDRQIDFMRQDPKTAPYAGKIIALFGPDNLEKFKSNREARESAEKKHAESVATGEYALRQSEVTKNLAEAAAAGQRGNSSGVVSDADADLIASAIMDGKQPPVLKNLYRNTGKIQASLARKGYDLARAQTDWNVTQKRLATMNSSQQVRLSQAVEFAYESLPLLKQRYEDWKNAVGVSGVKVFNKAALETSKNLPGNAGAAAQALETQIADITSELGTVYKGGNSSTDESLALAAKNFSADWNEQTFNRAYDLVEQNLRIRKNSIALSVNPVGVSANSPYPSNPQSPQSPAPTQPQATRVFSVSAWLKANPNGDANAAKAAAQQAGYQVTQ